MSPSSERKRTSPEVDDTPRELLTGGNSRDTVAGLRATVELAPIGLAQFDAAGRFLRVNQRLCEILGCSRADLVRRTFHEISFPEDLPRCLELTAQLAAREIPDYATEKRFVKPNGTIVWARITVSAVRRPNGEVEFFIGVVEDITAHVATSEALRSAEERLRAALDASMIGTFKFDVRQNALEWADGLERVFGTNEPRTLEDFLSLMHPDDRPVLLDAYRRSVTEGADLEEEFRVTWPDGTIHWLHDRGRVVLGDDGRPQSIVGAITDISNHKRMQQVIAEREAQFRTIANTIPQFAWIAHRDGSRSWFNDRWFDYTGLTREQAVGFGWTCTYPEEAAQATLDAQRAAFAAGAMWEGTVQLRGRDGEYRWFLSRAMPVVGDDGFVTQWFGTNTDITEQKAAEREREQMLERERSARRAAERATAHRHQVLGFVAHDLRNPLQTIFLTSTSLLDARLTPEQLEKHVDVIQRCSREMDRLIADLLDVSRIEAGTFDVRHEPTALPPVITEVVERCHEHSRERDVQLQVRIDPATRPVLGDGQRLGQALTNLVANAVKFTPAGGRVLISTRQAADHVEIEIDDTGCGIPAGDLPLIFERFWQASPTSGGAGLGLAIVHGIITSHRGDIRVTSEPGRGTTFHLRLPSVT